MTTFIMIHDLVDPGDPQGRSYKQVNADRQHAIPIGALVEIELGVRLFVVALARDCDMTPLYTLSPYCPAEEEWRSQGSLNEHYYHGRRLYGYGEESLTVIAATPDTSNWDE